MKVMVTGHRPGKLGGYNKNSALNQKVIAALDKHLVALMDAYPHPDLTCCSGMALGVDQWWADLCSKHIVPWVAFLPCAQQWAKWPASSKAEWERLLAKATLVRHVSQEPYTHGCMNRRNQAMVDWADLCIAVWDGSPGGTADAVSRARSAGVDIYHIINPKEV